MQFSFVVLSTIAALASARPGILVPATVDECTDFGIDPTTTPSIGGCVFEGGVYGGNGPQMICTEEQNDSCPSGDTCACCYPPNAPSVSCKTFCVMMNH